MNDDDEIIEKLQRDWIRAKEVYEIQKEIDKLYNVIISNQLAFGINNILKIKGK